LEGSRRAGWGGARGSRHTIRAGATRAGCLGGEKRCGAEGARWVLVLVAGQSSAHGGALGCSEMLWALVAAARVCLSSCCLIARPRGARWQQHNAAGSGKRTVESGEWTADSGQRTAGSGRRTAGSTMDRTDAVQQAARAPGWLWRVAVAISRAVSCLVLCIISGRSVVLRRDDGWTAAGRGLVPQRGASA